MMGEDGADIRGDEIDEDDLADSTETTSYRLVKLDASSLTNPTLLRATVGVALGLAVLVWPNRSDTILSRLVGLAFVWLSLASLYRTAKHGPRRLANLLVGVAGLAAGLFLLASPDQSAVFLGRLIGVALIVLAGREAANHNREDSRWTALTPAAAIAAAGALIFAFPKDLLAVATSLAALGWIALSVVVIAVSLDVRQQGTTGYRGALELAGTWLRERAKSVDTRQTLYAKILYEGDEGHHKMIRFFTLMGFAAVIASMGVLTDSTAVVIGAMLIAPLMTPLMGMAISLVMGWPNRLARSALVALAGIAFAIGIGALIGVLAPTVIDTATNSQITSRSSPTILDLIIAVAAGGAGAYGLSRPDVSDSLPGVAVAIALVPPLAVVGISYSQGDWSSGNGALLLFATNMLAILVIGGLTFVLTGVTPVTRVANTQNRVGTALAAVGIATAIVLGGLLLNGAQTASNLFEQSRTESTIDDWLTSASSHSFVAVNIDDDTITAVVTGPAGGLPSVESLAQALSDSFGRPMTVNVRLIVEERLTATGN